ncbi:MAG TPA: hypothetical protein VGL10_10260 [Gammaproteobacteria bacterium]
MMATDYFQMTHRSRHRIIALLTLAVGGMLLSNKVLAQSGWFLSPALEAARVYDDNIFFSPTQPLDDYIIRVSPAIATGYRSVPLTLEGAYTVDVERYREHSELDSDHVREDTALDLIYQANQLLTFLADANHIETEIAGELSPETSLELGRSRAERYTFNPAAIYQFDRVTVGTMSFNFTRDEFVGGVSSKTNALTLNRDKRINPRSIVSTGYRFERFNFDPGENVGTHTLFAGITHELTRLTSVSILAGPQFSHGSVEAEVAASLAHQFDRGDFNLMYSRDQTSIIGLAGITITENIAAIYSHALGSDGYISLRSGFSRSELGGLEADISTSAFETGYQLTRYLRLFAVYEHSSQRGSLEPTDDFDQINRNIMWLGFAAGAPPRTELTPRPRVGVPTTLFEGLIPGTESNSMEAR